MKINDLLENILAEIDAESARLEKARALLAGVPAPVRHGRSAKAGATPEPKKNKRRPMSTEARERIRQAQFKRWAAVRDKPKKNAK